MNNVVAAWLVEFLKRFALKSPKFFQVLQTVGIIATLITGLPAFIEWLNSDFNVGITLPAFWLAIQSKVIAWCGFIMWVMAKQPIEDNEKQSLTLKEKKENIPYTYKKEK